MNCCAIKGEIVPGNTNYFVPKT